MLTRSPHRVAPWRAALAAALATALLAPAAAHATPPGGNGDLFVNQRESQNYLTYDPALSPDGQQPFSWADGAQRGVVRSSPDGIHVAYWSEADHRIAYGDVDGTQIRVLPGTTSVRDLVFSPDGTKLAYTTNDRIFTVPVDGAAQPSQLGSTLTGTDSIEWAPDGSAIVVSGAGAGGDRDLYAVDPGTGARRPLTATAGLDENNPSFAPDGAHLAFTASDDDPAHDRIDIAGADGSVRHTLVAEAGVDWPQWAPDGSRIAFTTLADSASIATIKPDGSGRRGVADDSAVVQMSWLIARGTGNKAPAASFTADPAQPYAGGPITLTSTSTDADGTIASEQWDLDGDGQYDDASGHVAHVTFSAAGAHTVRLKVKDDVGAAGFAEQTLTVLKAGMPGAAFSVDPATPIVDRPATLTAAPNVDPNAHVLHHEWDFEDDGTYDADTGESRSVQHTYTSIGTHTARLRVTDADGDHATETVTFDVRDEVRCGKEWIGKLTLDGCLTVKGDRRVATTGVTINGFTFGGSADGVLAIDATARRAFAIKPAQVQDFLDHRLDAPAAGTPWLPVSSCGEALGTSQGEISNFGASPKTHLSLSKDKTFAGLTPTTVDDLEFDGDDTAHFTVSGLFPRLLLNFTAEAVGSYTSGGACGRRKLSVTVQEYLGRFVKLPHITLERVGDDRWDGIAEVQMTNFPLFGEMQARVSTRAGRISSLALSVDDVPIMPGLRLSSSNLTLRLDRAQEELSGQVDVETFPRLLSHTVVHGHGSIRLNGSGLHVEGLVEVMDHELGWGYLDINTNKSIDAGVEAELSLGPAYAKADISGYFGLDPLAFELVGHAKIGIKGIGSLGGSLLVSSKGIAACGEIDLGIVSVEPGFSYRYGDTWPKVFLDSCDFGGLRVARASSATAASAKARSVQVAGGQRAVVIVAQGRPGRAPRIALTGPHGQRITSKANGRATRSGRFLVVPNPQDGTTNVLVARPAPGTWRVRALDGRVIKRVGTANALPEPSIAVKRDRKAKRLSWTLRPIAGQTVKLVEMNATGHVVRQLKATNRPKGIVKAYVPAAGATKVVAEVIQNGLLRETKTVVKLTAAK